MSYDIAFRCDSADSVLDLIHHAYGDRDDVHLVAYAVNGDTPAIVYDFAAEPVATTKPVLRNLDIMRTVTCPKPGCPGIAGQWCGNGKNGKTYGAAFMHTARKQIAQR